MDMYENYEFKHLDITMSVKCDEEEVFTIVEKLRPDWRQKDVEIKRIVAG